MAGQIPGSSSKPRARILTIIATLGALGVLAGVWLGGCSRRSAPLNLAFWSVSFSPDGGSVVTGGGYKEASHLGELVFWKIGDQDECAVTQPHAVRTVAWSPDGKFVAVGDTAGVTKLVDPATGKTRLSFSPPASRVNTVAVSRNGKQVAAATYDGTLELWDSQGKEQQVSFISGEKFQGVAISPTSEAMAATGFSGTAYLFNLIDKADPLKVQAYAGPPMKDPSAECVAFSSDGLSFATGSLTTLRIWDARTGAMQQEMACSANVNNIAFAPDGDAVATIHEDGALALWNYRTGVKLNSIQAHPGQAFGLSFSPDGRRIATVSLKDYIIKIWDAGTLQIVAEHHRFSDD